jgi:2-oxoglutarate/2-oxoacid ferredoxin oxidoreductase subunit alpha
MTKTNDFVIRFANVNGTGSASANFLFAKAIFRMGIPISAKNIFPSNIQGLPTWYEVRISEKGYMGRRAGIDIIVAVNPESLDQDIQDVAEGGYLLYDSTKKLYPHQIRPGLNYLGVPLMKMCNEHYKDPRQRQLFKNIAYVGALSALLNIEFQVLEDLLSEQFKGKEKLIPMNVTALKLGADYVSENFKEDIGLKLERRDLTKNKILVDGNTACGLGAIFGGATLAAWYPITPSTSVAQAFESYGEELRVEEETGEHQYAVIQAEDELAAMGMVIGAGWNGARAFTATSGPGLSLMNEFIGLAYFAEIPSVLIDVQRTGPSTGMPTRSQQSDILMAAYASHGDTKHPILFPANPKECFDMTAESLDLADEFQTPIMLLTDLDLGMNDHVSESFSWEDGRKYKRGKVLSAQDLDEIEKFGRYLDMDGDGVPYRTIPGTHPTKGSYFTRGTSKDEYAVYTEDGEEYRKNMDRLLVKWNTMKKHVPVPEFYQQGNLNDIGLIFFGTSTSSAEEAMDEMADENVQVDAMRIRSFPFNSEVENYIENHKIVFVIEQNRDGQMRTLLINELQIDPNILIPVLNYNGMPITAEMIRNSVLNHIK